MHMKSFTADSSETSSREMKEHIRSRLAKATSYALQLRRLYSSPGSPASDVDVVEAAAYATSLSGALAFEKAHWEDALREFAVSRICYDALLVGGGRDKSGEVYKEFLTSTVDPSIRYAAYQMGIARTVDIGVLARQFFPKEGEGSVEGEDLVERAKKLHSGIFGDGVAAPGDVMEGVEQTVVVNEVNWRGRTASVDDADIAVSLGEAKRSEEELRKILEGKKDKSKRTADDFDGVLAAWQDCVTETKKAIDKAHAEGVSGADLRLQKLQLIYTYVNYGLIGWRVGRNRLMAKEIEEGLKEAEEVQLGKLRELVVLYDAILQVWGIFTANRVGYQES